MRKLLTTLFLGVTLSTPLTVTAADLKIGFVNTQRVFAESQVATRAQKKLEKEFSNREQEIQRKMKQAQDLQSSLEKDGLTMADAERIRKQRELASLNRDIQQSQREFREDLNMRKNEELAAVHERARKVIMEIAEREKYDLILENVVYASPKVDITERVLKALDR